MQTGTGRVRFAGRREPWFASRGSRIDGPWRPGWLARLGLAVACILGLAGPSRGVGEPDRLRERREAFRRLYAGIRGERGSGSPESPRPVTTTMRLAVGLMTRQTQVRVTGTAPFRAIVGDRSIAGAPGQVFRAVLVAGEPAGIEYHAVVDSFPAGRLDEAQKRAHAGLAGRPSRLVWTGRELTAAGTILFDGREVLVSAGSFATEAEARARLAGQPPGTGVARVQPLLVSPPAGTLALVGPEGDVLGRGPEIRWELDGPADRDTGIVPGAWPGPDRGPGSRTDRRRSPSSQTARPALRVFDVVYDVGLPGAGMEDREYAGTIRAVVDAAGKLAAVNDIELEPYLEGVVPSEIYASDPMETIKAQAIASRSKTLVRIARQVPVEPFDICADQYCQVYRGLMRQHPRTSQGVRETAGRVLRHTGRMVAANFSDACGGHTENVENVWSGGPDPALVGRSDEPAGGSFPDPLTEEALRQWLEAPPTGYCRGDPARPNPRYRWTRVIEQSRMARYVTALEPLGRIRRLTAVRRGVSGRLITLEFTGENGSARIHKELPIRRLLGGLPSALFVALPEGGSGGFPARWRLKGGGWGHGVGLCQTGARGRALAGSDHAAILAHYFHGSILETLPGEPPGSGSE